MRLTLFICLVVLINCTSINKKDEELSPEQINAILGQFSETDEVFVKKNISFDSVVTYAGFRSLGERSEKIKMKLFYYDDNCRGYFNIPHLDNKNLQVFGKKMKDDLILKCVTKINMEEAGGFMFLVPELEGYSGTWSNGHVNFKLGRIELKKQSTDYNTLAEWQ
jgi:hypothetical protein